MYYSFQDTYGYEIQYLGGHRMREINYVKGSYTVEAAILLSITFFVMGALILGTFYLHDRAVCQSAACETAAAGSNLATQRERSEAVAKLKRQFKKSRLLGSRSLNGNTAAGAKQVFASWQAVFPVPGFAMKYYNGSRLGISGEWTSSVTDAADMIRKIRGAEKLLAGDET